MIRGAANFLDAAREIERSGRKVVVPAFQYFAAATQGIGPADMRARTFRIGLGNKERLREEGLNLPSALQRDWVRQGRRVRFRQTQ